LVAATNRSISDTGIARPVGLATPIKTSDTPASRDPVLLGVHPAARDDGGQAPMYVTRDVDDRVDAAVLPAGCAIERERQPLVAPTSSPDP
jgi:hypothetical protein